MTLQAPRAFLPAGLLIDEPDVSLTDFGLALETALFAVVLARRPSRWPRLRGWSVAFFGSAAAASLAGGTDHGFFRRGGRERGHDSLWVSTLLAIGASSLALIGIGSELGLDRPLARWVVTVAAGATGAYALLVLSGRRDFRMAIVAYAPAALYLLAVLVRRYARRRDRPSRLGIAAVALSGAAACVQQLEIGVDRVGISHNGLYHLIQAVGFALLFAAVRELIDEPHGPASDATPVLQGASHA